MCCFSNGPVLERVSGTQIFARPTERNGQLLAYSMTVAASGALAMILPLPVPPGSPEDALRFINLEGYPDFFDDLNKGFPLPVSRGRGPAPATLMMSGNLLVVHDVGAFEASFVPSQADFSPLDPRFSNSPDIWAQLPTYGDYGFAVFKLKGFDSLPWWKRLFAKTKSTQKTIHPMAFEFPRRDPNQLFFPTVHIHDGAVHETAHFDHTLYCQAHELTTKDENEDKNSKPLHTSFEWLSSYAEAQAFMKVDKSQGLIDGDLSCYREKLRGDLPNQDTFLALN
jgi:hypothetical protein